LVGTTCGQQDLIDRVAKQAVEIDSLKRAIQIEKGNQQQLSSAYRDLKDSLAVLVIGLSHVESLKADKQIQETQLQNSRDSIASLQSTLAEKEKQVSAERQKREQEAKEEKEKGKNEILAHIINHYNNKSFDALLSSSAILSLSSNLQLIDSSMRIDIIVSDLEKYFQAKELLSHRFNEDKIKNALNQLHQIKQESESLEKLRGTVENYQIFDDGFEEMINRIIKLDNDEVVAGLGAEI